MAALAVLSALLAGAAGVTWLVFGMPGDQVARHESGKPVSKVRMPEMAPGLGIILDTEVMPIAPEEAKDINDKRPLDLERLVAAKPFRIGDGSAEDPHIDAAVTCLAQAIYYEASSEELSGQRAVAQVVLNRVRHPAFPNTVCGVVFQGSERVTGCQFSFTCDGSLRRMPSIAGFKRARQIARDALNGKVEAEVGTSTHYHANYVVPYWAPTLDKAKQIGLHIFYQMRGFLGSPRAFTMAYKLQDEFLPGTTALAETVIDDTSAPDGPLAESTRDLMASVPPLHEDVRVGKIVSQPEGSLAQPRVGSPLRADSESGTLDVETPRLRVDGDD